ncbi:hypothetical protein MTR_6g464180 [Medicago truncatula]|uniref:Uncharacterized protein n=1 Tax=Medicago truncatula TaxID=3880 RepID=A0A072UBY6_MEDTR|nr:hypothetical protein MTR_6g464180 [Medicago truncatula]
MTHRATLKALDITLISLRASTSFSLLPFVLVVRFSNSMASSSLLILYLVVISLNSPGIIKHTTLIHQSIKISDLLNTHILIDIRPKLTFKLHTLRNHCIFNIDVWKKSRKLFKLRRILSYRHAPLLQVQELYFLPGPQTFREILPQELNFELCPSHNFSTNLKSSLRISPPILGLLSKHVSNQPDLLVITCHHSTEYPLYALHPSLISLRVKPSLERWRIVPQETIKPPLLSFSLVPTTSHHMLIRLSQHLSHCNQSLCNRNIISATSHLNTTQTNQQIRTTVQQNKCRRYSITIRAQQENLTSISPDKTNQALIPTCNALFLLKR